jgi:nascent polypeptide-associated complex subunit alpha
LNKCTKSEEPVVEDEEDDDEDDDDEDDKDEDDAEGDFVTSVNFHFLFS